MGKIKGKVVSGLEKGGHFLSLKEYKERIKEKLKLGAYEGTLNVKVDREERKFFLSKLNPIKIDSFNIGNKQYWGIICYKIRINNIKGAIIVPLKTAHPEDTLEIVAEINLREKLNLKDGDEVKLDS